MTWGKQTRWSYSAAPEPTVIVSVSRSGNDGRQIQLPWKL